MRVVNITIRSNKWIVKDLPRKSFHLHYICIIYFTAHDFQITLKDISEITHIYISFNIFISSHQREIFFNIILNGDKFEFSYLFLVKFDCMRLLMIAYPLILIYINCSPLTCKLVQYFCHIFSRQIFFSLWDKESTVIMR